MELRAVPAGKNRPDTGTKLLLTGEWGDTGPVLPILLRRLSWFLSSAGLLLLLLSPELSLSRFLQFRVVY